MILYSLNLKNLLKIGNISSLHVQFYKYCGFFPQTPNSYGK